SKRGHITVVGRLNHYQKNCPPLRIFSGAATAFCITLSPCSGANFVAHLKKVKLSTVCWERLSSFIQTLQILQLTSQATTASFRSLSTTPSRLALSLPNRHENCIISVYVKQRHLLAKTCNSIVTSENKRPQNHETGPKKRQNWGFATLTLNNELHSFTTTPSFSCADAKQ